MGDKKGVRGGSSGALVRAQHAILYQRVDLSGETVANRTFVGECADRAKIADTIFRGCQFVECSFRTADFEAVVFENCSFNRCNFKTADFRSSQFARCTIDDCNFSSGAIKNTDFSECKIGGGRFDRQSLDENSWSDCRLDGVSFRRSTALHMEFNRCEFVRTQFADCTSLYHFFRGCRFSKSRMDVDNVALSFGLTRENLQELTLVWQGLGQRTPRQVPILLKQLLDGFAERRWGIAACSLAINFSLLSTREALRLAFASMRLAMQPGQRLRSGEVKFLAHLVNELSQRAELPFLSVVEGLDLCADLGEMPACEANDSLRSLAFTLKEAELQILARWQETWDKLATLTPPAAQAEFVFEHQPDHALLSVLGEVHRSRGGRQVAPQVIDARTGSYIEVVMLSIGSLGTFVIVLGMVGRSIDGLITIRAKTEVLLAKRLPPAVRTRALQPLPSTSAELAREINTCMALISGGHLPLLSVAAPNIIDQLRALNVSPGADVQDPAHDRGDAGRREIEHRTGEG
jgi:uncharacterized protein YjbI with pentapeptide repeats